VKWLKYLKTLFSDKKTSKKVTVEDLESKDISQREAAIKQLELSLDLEENIEQIKKLFGNSFDLNIRRINVGADEFFGALIYIDSLVGNEMVNNILHNLNIDLLERLDLNNKLENNTYQIIVNKVLSNKNITETDNLEKITKDLASGYTAILFSGIKKVILCETKELETRAIEEPEAEVSLRGPRDGFVENIEVNISLLRRRLRIPHLWVENLELGKLSKTNISIAYIKGLASEELLDEVRERLNRIEVDTVLDSGRIQEYIIDQPFTLFPLVKRTERVDGVVSCLAEGRVAILTSETPFVLIAPTTYNSLLQSVDDYNEIFPLGSFIRMMRHFSFVISLILPGAYVAIINYHPELLPITLLLRIASSREGVPFPVLIEAIIMEVLFEVLREAGLRLPKAFGAAVSIVGALILGEAAITAGLVSPAMVIIVALTAIASFTTPDYTLALAARVTRFGFLFLGGAAGLFGIQFGLLLLLIHLVSLRSFGQPYFQPYGPLIWSDLKDSIIRVFWWKQQKRPKLTAQREPNRQEKNQKPGPDNKKES